MFVTCVACVFAVPSRICANYTNKVNSPLSRCLGNRSCVPLCISDVFNTVHSVTRRWCAHLQSSVYGREFGVMTPIRHV